MELSRRRFIGFTMGAAAGAAVGLPGGEWLSGVAAAMDQPTWPPGGPESQRLSVCDLCPGGCGLRVRCIGGRPVKLDGNPLHPVNGGRLCPKGQAALQSLYHPDRVVGPLRRVGPRGSLASFQPASWDEALGEIGVRLGLLRRQQRPEALALLHGDSRSVGTRLARRFLEAFGSPNDIRLPRGNDAAAQALLLTQGVRAMPAHDLAAAELVLSFGSGFLESWSSPVHAMRAFGEFRQGRIGRRGKLVQVESRLSLTGNQADETVLVHPGSEGILALGIAAVLVAEELYDKEFVGHRTAQFEDALGPDGELRAGLRSLLERSFSLDGVAAATGVSVNRILQLAREFGAARPGVALGPRKGPLVPGQLFDHLGVQVLNALAGSIDAPGGVLVPEPGPLPAWPALPADEVAAAGRARPRLDLADATPATLGDADPEALVSAVLSRSPYEIGALLLLDADPAFTSMSPGAFAAALEYVPLSVSFAGLPDDSAVCCDWILPQAHFLERWDLFSTPAGVPYPLASLAKPVLDDPLHDVRSVGEVFLELARRVGGPVAQALPWSDVPTLLRAESAALFEAHRGAVIGTEFDDAWVRLMERAGWWAPGYRTEQELWKLLGERGGWWDPFYDHGNWGRVLRTATGRFEFRPAELAALLASKRPAGAAQGERSVASQGADPHLALLLFEPLPVSGGVGSELPFLQQILDPLHGTRWETWVELHPETAGALGVRDSDVVRVSSPHGALEGRARLTHHIAPWALGIPVGLGRRGGGRWAQGRGANPLALLSPVREPLSGLPDLEATRVRVAALAAARGTTREEA